MTTFEPGARLVFTQGFTVQAALDGFFRQQARAQHQRRIRSIRATGDRRDDHRAAGKFERVAVVSHGDMLRGRAFHDFRERSFRIAQRHAVLRPLRSGDGRLHGAEIEFQLVAE